MLLRAMLFVSFKTLIISLNFFNALIWSIASSCHSCMTSSKVDLLIFIKASKLHHYEPQIEKRWEPTSTRNLTIVPEAKSPRDLRQAAASRCLHTTETLRSCIIQKRRQIQINRHEINTNRLNGATAVGGAARHKYRPACHKTGGYLARLFRTRRLAPCPIRLEFYNTALTFVELLSVINFTLDKYPHNCWLDLSRLLIKYQRL